MASRTPRTSGSSSGGRRPATGGRGSKRVTGAPVKSSFPWGFAAGATALAVALVAILGYAIANRGSGFQTAADKLDGTFKGIQVADNPSFNHVETRVKYPSSATRAPDGGNHNPYPQTCAVYTQPIVNEHAVHSLEHGAVWITYKPDLAADQVAVLAKLVEADTAARMVSPYPGQTSPVALQAWGRRLDVPSATDPRVARFVDGYTQGPQTREQGASCSGVDQPGTVPFVLSSDGQTFVPGTDTQEVPAEGNVPGGAEGSAAPGQVPSPAASAPAPTAPAPLTTAPVPAPSP